MQASRAFIAMLVLVASAFVPALSAPLECVVVPLISCGTVTADLFVGSIQSAWWATVRNDHVFLSLLGIGWKWASSIGFQNRNKNKNKKVCRGHVLWLDCNGDYNPSSITILKMCLTTFHYIHEFNLSMGFVAPFISSIASNCIWNWTSNHPFPDILLVAVQI